MLRYNIRYLDKQQKYFNNLLEIYSIYYLHLVYFHLTRLPDKRINQEYIHIHIVYICIICMYIHTYVYIKIHIHMYILYRYRETDRLTDKQMDQEYICILYRHIYINANGAICLSAYQALFKILYIHPLQSKHNLC